MYVTSGGSAAPLPVVCQPGGFAPGVGSGRVTPDERWLAAAWPFVRARLPAAPARVAEIGCGPLGGFVPMLHASGYEAVGIDPEAPLGPGYSQVEFEHYDMPWAADAIVACASLHHVADLGAVLDLVEAALVPGGSAGDRGVGARAIRRGHRAMVLRPAARARKRSRLAAASVRGMARFRPELGRLLPFLGGGRRACIRARTSCASSGRGSAPGPLPTGLTSSPS